jgi:hypothetical protein
MDFNVRFVRGLVLVDLSPNFPVEIAFANQPRGEVREVGRSTTSEKIGAMNNIPPEVIKAAKNAAASAKFPTLF